MREVYVPAMKLSSLPWSTPSNWKSAMSSWEARVTAVVVPSVASHSDRDTKASRVCSYDYITYRYVI